MTAKPVIVIGAGGHAKSVLGSLLRSGTTVIGLIDRDSRRHGATVLGVPVIGDDDDVLARDPTGIMLVNGIGNIGPAKLRSAVTSSFASRGYGFASVVDPTAILGHEVQIGCGVQILAGAIVQAGCTLEDGVVVNSRAVLDHDCYLASHVHVATGATMAGNVTVGPCAFVGCGATVRQGVTIGAEAVIGAGAVVVQDVPMGEVVVGIPARPLNRKV